MILNFWWSIFPSMNIRVYYRMVTFTATIPAYARAVFLKTAFEKCTPREQQFLKEIRGQ